MAHKPSRVRGHAAGSDAGLDARATRQSIVDFSESQILAIVIAFYRLGDVLYAPNDELVTILRERTSKPVLLMKRSIDT